MTSPQRTTRPAPGEHHPRTVTNAPAAADWYRVWAPNVSQVVLHVEGEDVTMRQAPQGWWIAERQRRDGEAYGYVLDGEGPFPDPRSPYQPDGVHMLSQWVDHARFTWTDATWQPPPLASAVIYELHIGTFTPDGTFEGAIARLDYLAELGVTHVELMPVCEFSGRRGWGYDGVDLFAPHHGYGGPEGLKRLVDACHARSLAVILDVVYNHLGPSGNYLSRFGPYFTDRYHTPWGDAVNLDGAGSDEVRRFFCDNALMWLRDYHMDGLRLDAVHAFVDTSATHLLEQMAAEVEALEAAAGRRFVLIAESDLNDPRIVQSRERGGYGIHAQWSDDFHHALHSVITGEQSGYYEDFGRLAHLATALRQAFVYAGAYSVHRKRVHGRRPDGIPGWRFIVAAQNHDQVGNRARGERLAHLTTPDRLKIAAALVLTAPFIPMLFQGEEWAASSPFLYFTSHEDEELGRLVAEGRRREFAAFGWKPSEIPDPQAPDTFEQSRLRWDEIGQPAHAELLHWYRSLIALRRESPSLRNGDYRRCRVLLNEEAGWLVLYRAGVAVVCNFSNEAASIAMPGADRVMLASDSEAEAADGAVWVSSHSVAIVAVEPAAAVDSSW